MAERGKTAHAYAGSFKFAPAAWQDLGSAIEVRCGRENALGEWIWGYNRSAGMLRMRM
jgi:hypothetical protein